MRLSSGAMRDSGTEVRLPLPDGRLLAATEQAGALELRLDERPLVQVTNEALKLGLYLVRYVVPVRLGLRPPPGDAASPPAI